MNLWISLTKIENEVTLSWTGCKWAVHYEYATWGAFNLSLPLFTAPVSLWFLSLVLFNISLCCSGMGKPCFWLPVRCATSHCASTLHLSTHFLKGEENHTWTGSLDAENAQESVMLVWHRCWRKRLKGDRMFRVVTFIVFFLLSFLDSVGILYVLCWMTFCLYWLLSYWLVCPCIDSSAHMTKTTTIMIISPVCRCRDLSRPCTVGSSWLELLEGKRSDFLRVRKWTFLLAWLSP